VATTEARMSRADAGRKGGLTTKKRYGPNFYQQIGRKGGKKGGLTTKQRYGPDFYRTIGRKGGSR
jgi:general stress protein YciG